MMKPLCVDLDGSLILGDLLWETLVRAFRDDWRAVFGIVINLFRGRAHLKRWLASRVRIFPEKLPFNEDLIKYLREERAKGRKIALVTAADFGPANEIALFLGLFDSVYATKDGINLSGKRKAALLVNLYGDGGFDYVGDSWKDIAVWRHSNAACLVNAGPILSAHVRRKVPILREFKRARPVWRAAIRSMRPYQWAKNAVVLVPIIAGHQILNGLAVKMALIAVSAFCLVASSVYIINDVLDVDSDRYHPRKSLRPIASGDLGMGNGLTLATVLLVFGLCIAANINKASFYITVAYTFGSIMYCICLKRYILIDVIVLAGFYTMRLVMGGYATGIELSEWLIAFSMFIFLSLALLKRFTEVQRLSKEGPVYGKGRGYLATDLGVLGALGCGTACLAALVLALYVSGQNVVILYRYPRVLLLSCPVIFYWLGCLWLSAYRGEMGDDPVVYALADGRSIAAGAAVLFLVWCAT